MGLYLVGTPKIELMSKKQNIPTRNSYFTCITISPILQGGLKDQKPKYIQDNKLRDYKAVFLILLKSLYFSPFSKAGIAQLVRACGC